MLTAKKIKNIFSTIIIVLILLFVGLKITFFIFDNGNEKNKFLKEKYQRKKHFGTWKDINKSGFNTRYDLLLKNSIDENTKVIKKKNKKWISGGMWREKFGNEIFYKSNQATIDHIVSLKEAWISGACGWDQEKRKLFFNFPIKGQLVIMSRKTNAFKKDHDPKRWMPNNPNKTEEFLYTWIDIKKHWNLALDKKEWKILKKFLGKSSLKGLKIAEPKKLGCY